jgi:hypothetical protein
MAAVLSGVFVIFKVVTRQGLQAGIWWNMRNYAGFVDVGGLGRSDGPWWDSWGLNLVESGGISGKGRGGMCSPWRAIECG